MRACACTHDVVRVNAKKELQWMRAHSAWSSVPSAARVGCCGFGGPLPRVPSRRQRTWCTPCPCLVGMPPRHSVPSTAACTASAKGEAAKPAPLRVVRASARRRGRCSGGGGACAYGARRGEEPQARQRGRRECGDSHAARAHKRCRHRRYDAGEPMPCLRACARTHLSAPLGGLAARSSPGRSTNSTNAMGAPSPSRMRERITRV